MKEIKSFLPNKDEEITVRDMMIAYGEFYRQLHEQLKNKYNEYVKIDFMLKPSFESVEEIRNYCESGKVFMNHALGDNGLDIFNTNKKKYKKFRFIYNIVKIILHIGIGVAVYGLLTHFAR